MGLLALLPAGCGSHLSGPAAAYAPVGVLIGPELLAAAVDEAPEEVPRFLRPKVEPVAEPAPPEEQPGRAGRFGVRAGLLMAAGAAEGTWDPAIAAGLYYRGGRGTVYELGVDYASLGADYGGGRTGSSDILFLRCDVLFRRWAVARGSPVFFLLGGAELGLESATWEPTGDTVGRRSSSVNIGAGVGSPLGSWDARAVYSRLIGSDNAAGTVMTAFGFSF